MKNILAAAAAMIGASIGGATSLGARRADVMAGIRFYRAHPKPRRKGERNDELRGRMPARDRGRFIGSVKVGRLGRL